MSARWQHQITCVCGCGRTGTHTARGLLPDCYDRALRAGRLTDYPSHPMSLERRQAAARQMVQGKQAAMRARLEDYVELRSWGLSLREAVARLGVTTRTGWRYEQHLRQQTTTPEESTAA
ncbi:hypothetical protein [Nocardiopsis synnemataformans]|uniref:hypothetical protein n=1 Tax=Nocardiopsis synnemataformans TaxID=61305 RepID=UPI003EB798CC